MLLGTEIGAGHADGKIAWRPDLRNAQPRSVTLRCSAPSAEPRRRWLLCPPSGRQLSGNRFDLKPAPQRAEQALARGRVVGRGRHNAPNRLRPGGVAVAAADDVHMQLRDLVAERGDVELVVFDD